MVSTKRGLPTHREPTADLASSSARSTGAQIYVAATLTRIPLLCSGWSKSYAQADCGRSPHQTMSASHRCRFDCLPSSVRSPGGSTSPLAPSAPAGDRRRSASGELQKCPTSNTTHDVLPTLLAALSLLRPLPRTWRAAHGSSASRRDRARAANQSCAQIMHLRNDAAGAKNLDLSARLTVSATALLALMVLIGLPVAVLAALIDRGSVFPSPYPRLVHAFLQRLARRLPSQ
jgi:hypothetical protein